ncbi:hypothetical protein T4B_3342, partial [Trichinella pseudospiralis]
LMVFMVSINSEDELHMCCPFNTQIYSTFKMAELHEDSSMRLLTDLMCTIVESAAEERNSNWKMHIIVNFGYS